MESEVQQIQATYTATEMVSTRADIHVIALKKVLLQMLMTAHLLNDLLDHFSPFISL